MRQVIPGYVWIGNARDAQDVAAILSLEIRAVVHLAMEEPGGLFPREILYCRFPLLDGMGNPPAILKSAIQLIATLIEARIPILVTCGGGTSRAPAVVAAALAYPKRESPDEWLRKITASGPHDVAPALWNEIRACLDSN